MKKIPVVLRILAPLIAGILTGYFSGITLPFFLLPALLAVLLLTCLPGLHRRRVIRTSFLPLASLFFFALGLFLEELQDSRKNEFYFARLSENDTTNYYHLRITEPPEIKKKWIKCIARVEGTNGVPSAGQALVYFERDSLSSQLCYGDQVYAAIRFFPVKGPLNPHEFDYREYLRVEDIHHQAFIRPNQWIRTGNSANIVFSAIYRVRENCHEAIDHSGMSTENTGVARALLLGDKTIVDDQLMLSYAAAGALHVLAVSGLHVGIVMLILGFVFRPIKRIRYGKILFLFLALGGVWFYAIITGLSPSVLRAAVMFSFVIVGQELQRDHSIYQSLLASALFLVLIDPHLLFKVGFLLSYLAVFGIVFFHPRIFRLLQFDHFLLRKTWEIISVSIAAQIATFPLGIYCFHQFPNFFVLANLIVIPLSFVILVTGITWLFTSAVPLIGDLLLLILDSSISLLNGGVKWIEQLPLAVTWGISIHWTDVLLLYGFLFSLTLALMRKSRRLLLLALLLFSSSLVLNVYEKFNLFSDDQVVFYAVHNEVAIDIFYGEETTAIQSPSLAENPSKLNFHIYPQRYAHSGSKATSRLLELATTPSVYRIGTTTICIVSGDMIRQFFTNRLPVTDVVYLYQADFLEQPVIDQLAVSGCRIILGSGVGKKLNRYLEKCLGRERIYNLEQAGALVVRL